MKVKRNRTEEEKKASRAVRYLFLAYMAMVIMVTISALWWSTSPILPVTPLLPQPPPRVVCID